MRTMSEIPSGEFPEFSESAENAEQLRAIFHTAVEGIITIDSAGIIQSMNPAAEKLFGYAAEDAIGQNVKLLMPAPYTEEHDGYIANYLSSRVAKIIGIGREVTGRRKDGSTFPIKLAVSELNFRDRIMFTGFIEDLTERKRLEKEAEEWREELERRVEQRTHELELANQELEHFAHTISHDLRTPLRGIRNYVDFLREDLAGQVSGESAEDLDRLGRAAEELDQMIHELLQYSRIGRDESSEQRVSLMELLTNISSVVADGTDRIVEIASDLPDLWAPPGLVRQVFQNLIENGLTYNRSNQKRVSIRLADEQTPHFWTMIVTDNGIGIDPEYHDKIFGMFQRLHTVDEFAGTGIGLAAVRKAIHHLRGSIRLESKPGEGTSFFIRIPKQDHL